MRLTWIAQHKIDSIFEEIKRAKTSALARNLIDIAQCDDSTKPIPIEKSVLFNELLFQCRISELIKNRY